MATQGIVVFWKMGHRVRSDRLERHNKERGKYRLNWTVLGKRSRGDGNTSAEQKCKLDLSDVRGLKLMNRRGRTSCACDTESGVGTTATVVDHSYGEIREVRRHHDSKMVADHGQGRAEEWTAPTTSSIRHLPKQDMPFGADRDMPYRGNRALCTQHAYDYEHNGD